ncbi:MAG: hypothetical protein APF76_16925 [Desulfitibacter sp. BRH_c19]|nr:MAG: hypothetical protein APF76_16925 [Desulfitibacter sp. BRH_c19]
MESSFKKVAILFFSLVVVMLGFGMVIPIVPFYIAKLGAGGTYLGILIASYSVMQFIFAPIWGSISDNIGRRPVLMIGMLGNAVTILLFGLSSSLWMLIVARALSGVLSSATIPAAMAYIADSTTEDERGGSMGLLGGATGMGVVIGPGIGGLLAGNSLSTPFYLAAFLSIVGFLLILLFLPETSSEIDSQRCNEDYPVIQLKQLWNVLFTPIGFLLILTLILNFGKSNFQGIFGLYVLQKFNYNPEQVGTIMMVIGLIYAVSQGVFAGLITKRWGESRLIKVSLIASSAGFVTMIFAHSYFTVLFTAGFFVLFNALLKPAITSDISKKANMGLGIAMGLNESYGSLGRVIGPICAGFVFDINVNFPYIGGAIIMCLVFTISLFKL